MVISRVIIRVTPFKALITLLFTYLLIPLSLQVGFRQAHTASGRDVRVISALCGIQKLHAALTLQGFGVEGWWAFMMFGSSWLYVHSAKLSGNFCRVKCRIKH